MTHTASRSCPSCGGSLPADAELAGICVACAFELALRPSLPELGTSGVGDVWPTYSRACQAALAGRRSEALRLLRDALERGSADARWMLENPALGSLHEHPEFEKIVAAVRQGE